MNQGQPPAINTAESAGITLSKPVTGGSAEADRMPDTALVPALAVPREKNE